MDWNKHGPILTATAAVGGAIIAGIFLLLSQMIMQRNENLRAIRRIAYESAMIEWKTMVENKLLLPDGKPLSASVFINLHMARAGVLDRLNPTVDQDIHSLLDSVEWRMQSIQEEYATTQKKNDDSERRQKDDGK